MPKCNYLESYIYEYVIFEGVFIVLFFGLFMTGNFGKVIKLNLKNEGENEFGWNKIFLIIIKI